MTIETWKVYVGDENKGILTPFRILHLVQDLISDKKYHVIQITLIDNSSNLFSEFRYKNIKELRNAIAEFRDGNTLSGQEKALFKALGKLDDTLAWDIYRASYKFIDDFLF